MTIATPTMIGEHPVMQNIRRLVDRVAASDATVLVLGESGTGKEVVARLVHVLSDRAARPFVPVNCGAIPAELLESELFGHERGAFTGATNARAGIFQTANGGTVFLDEVGELSPAMQVKLLRVLQSDEIRPVGSDRTIHVDVRILAATNQNLAKAVAAGTFREDLYYRLNVIPIEIPPLRERRSDVPLLVKHALARLQAKSSIGPITIGDDAMAMLWEYDWPGNVREVENVIERLVVLADCPLVTPEDLPQCVRMFLSEKSIPQITLPAEGLDLNRVTDAFESALIDKALERSRGSKSGAARLLGIGRSTLVAKLIRRAQQATTLSTEPLSICA